MGKIYVTGDIHGHIEINKIWDWAKKENPQKDDYLIIAGDFGLIFYGKYAKKYETCEMPNLKKLNDMPFKTLFVDGNHENFDRLYSTEFSTKEWNGGKVTEIMPNIYHLKRGEIFNINGLNIFTLGGALSLDKHLRKPHISWWKEERLSSAEINYALENLERHNNEVDYVITHAAPRYFAKQIFDHQNLPFYSHDNTEIELEEILKDVKYKHWYCGHYHYDYSFGRNTTIYEKFLQLGEK